MNIRAIEYWNNKPKEIPVEVSKGCFLEGLTGLNLRDHQAEVLTSIDEHKHSCYYMSRRMGATTTIILDAVYNALCRKLSSVIFVQNGQMRLHISEILHKYLGGNIRVYSTNGSTTLNNGSTISVIGVNGNHFEGNTRELSVDAVYLDCADFIDDELIHSSILPITSSNHCKLVAISTFSGRSGTWFKQCMSNPHVYSKKYISSGTLGEYATREEIRREYLGEY